MLDVASPALLDVNHVSQVFSKGSGEPGAPVLDDVSLTLRAGFVEVAEARSDWAPDPAHPLPKFSPPRRVPHGVTLIGRLFDEGTLMQAGIALERQFNVAGERPPGF